MQAISKLVLGTVQFGLNYGINNTSGKPGQQAVNEMLRAAYYAGIRCLDTAEAYGNAHEVIGAFHDNYPDQKFNIITKLPHHIDGSIAAKIEKYLAELNVNQLQGLLFHSYQTYADNKPALNLLDNYKRNNKVKYIGVSVYTNAQMADVMTDERIDIIQLPFNLFDNANQRGEILSEAKERGKTIHTRSAFLQGLFFTPVQSESKIAKLLADELSYIRQLSYNWSISLQQIALNYCIQNPGIDNVLIGVDNLSQLQQNLNDAGISLPQQLIIEIDKIKIQNVDLLNPSLWNQ